ncbi:DarT ssDNA thymidine ADP-ribosyltransferase family protein [Agromyces laixinhei]|uniref:DarT ssDNA thymidine ADP-ribosyltransferase family protein n=1 Tax=Agromyces laixinhei TaxID=2585717 RepID=UPI00111632B4|nr:DarT ssDNA thymidine ADP-ribosyltransferase family protein [Agromyces laixinhei]
MSEVSRSLVAETQPCGHGIDIDACLFCAEFAANRVWLSDTEQFFHNRPDCETRTLSERRGRYSKDPNWRRQIGFAKAEREGARPCPQCRPYDPRRWRRKQPTERHIGELRLTHFTTLDNLIRIIGDREVVCRSRLDASVKGFGSVAGARQRAGTLVREPDVTALDCVPFSLTHRPAFMEALVRGRDDVRLVAPEERPPVETMIALETSFRRVIHRDPDVARAFELRWAVSSRDAGDPRTGIRHSKSDLIQLIDFARGATGDRFADHPIAQSAEFLVEQGVPFRLIDRVLVPSVALKRAVAHLLESTSIADPPDVRLRSHWFRL